MEENNTNVENKQETKQEELNKVASKTEGGMTDEQKDEVFTDDERVSQILKLSSDAYTRERKKIKIKSIGFLKPTQLGRKDTLRGLTQSIQDLGVVTPIHVMEVAEEEKDEDYEYILLDGLRRIYGALKNGETEIEAVVWNFKDKEKGMDVALTLSLVFNRVQKRSMAEIWSLYQILEMQDSFTPGTLEYLLQLRGGDAMKIKDIMMCEYEEVKDAFLHEEKDIDGCYRMLQKFRKEENEIDKEDETSVSELSDAADSIVDNNTGGKAKKGQLSDDQVKELLEMADDLDDVDDLQDLTDNDFSALVNVDEAFITQQQVGEREFLDPVLRNAVLARDDFTCKCCGLRMVGARLGLIAVHHKIPVHCSGKDTIDNLTTLCLNCHVSLHIMERNGGSIMMSKADFDKLPEDSKLALVKARKLAEIAIKADKERGLSKEDIKEATKGAIKHPMPGKGMKENEAAYAVAQKNAAQANESNTQESKEETDFEEGE